MRKVLWGVFFGSLIGVLLLAPQSNFTNRVRDLFYTLQDSIAAAWQKDSSTTLMFILIFAASLTSFLLLEKYNSSDKFSDEEIEYLKSKSTEELHLLQNRQNKNYMILQISAAIWLLAIGTLFGYFLGRA